MSHSHIIKRREFQERSFLWNRVSVGAKQKQDLLTYITVDIPNYEILHRKQNCTVWNKKLDQTNLFRKI